MQYPSWASSRRKNSYLRRSPECSALYRLIYNYREEFEYSWDDMFRNSHGILRQEVLETFDKYLDCGILRHGAARARCEQCNHSILIAFSCKRRGVCPSCQAKRSVLFAENLHENVLLPHSHRHVIFSIPKRLRIYFRYDRGLFDLFYRAAWHSWSEYVCHKLPEGEPGAVMALHTSGELLKWHPHIHAMVLDGALRDGNYIRLDDVDAEKLQESFTQKLLSVLVDKGLLEATARDSILSQEHTGFNVYAGEPISGDDENARLFLARYLKKSPLNASWLSIEQSEDEPRVIYTKDSADGEVERQEFTPLHFLAELSLHIPKTFEQMSRFYGIYSCRTRGAKRIKEELEAFSQAAESAPDIVLPEIAEKGPEEDKPKSSASWARCMKRVFELDPLCCPKCSAQMKIVAFLHNPSEIERIATNLGYTTWRAPPKFEVNGRLVDYSDEYSQVS